MEKLLQKFLALVMVGMVAALTGCASTPPPAEEAPPPAPEETAAPEAAPADTPSPSPSSTAKVDLTSFALFDFGKATLRPIGKSQLDGLIAQARDAAVQAVVTAVNNADRAGIKGAVVTAVGHADRIGSDAGNKKLSERRAAAVKQYLVSKGIKAERIKIEGRGNSQPVTGNSCDNLGAESGRNKKLVDCLQPDRRVGFELAGMGGFSR